MAQFAERLCFSLEYFAGEFIRIAVNEFNRDLGCVSNIDGFANVREAADAAFVTDEDKVLSNLLWQLRLPWIGPSGGD
jgi:hypothetical protein